MSSLVSPGHNKRGVRRRRRRASDASGFPRYLSTAAAPGPASVPPWRNVPSSSVLKCFRSCRAPSRIFPTSLAWRWSVAPAIAAARAFRPLPRVRTRAGKASEARRTPTRAEKARRDRSGPSHDEKPWKGFFLPLLCYAERQPIKNIFTGCAFWIFFCFLEAQHLPPCAPHREPKLRGRRKCTGAIGRSHHLVSSGRPALRTRTRADCAGRDAFLTLASQSKNAVFIATFRSSGREIEANRVKRAAGAP